MSRRCRCLPVARRPPLARRRAKGPPEFAALKYRLVGPFAGGRVSRACGGPRRPAHLLRRHRRRRRVEVHRRRPHLEADLRRPADQSASARIAVAPSRPERRLRRHRRGQHPRQRRGRATASTRSTDAGKTWKHVWKQVGQIGTMAVHPKNADVAFAAVLGHAVRPEPASAASTAPPTAARRGSRCCSRTTTPARQRRVHRPEQPARRLRRAVAGAPPAVGDDQRRPRQRTCTSPATAATPGRSSANPERKDERGDEAATACPTGPWGKIGVAVAPSDSQRVYALIEAEKGGLFRSDDGGETWERVNDDRHLRQRAWYYSTLTVHPTNPDVVYCPAGAAAQEHRRRQDVHAASRARTTATTTTSGSTRRTRDRMIDAQRRRRGHHAPTAARRGTPRRCRSASSTTSRADNRTPYRVMGVHAGPRHAPAGRATR